jgi:hypothetical protein
MFLLVGSTILAQNGSQFKDWVAPADDVRAAPKIACRELRSGTGYEFSVITADLIAAAEGVPEHCRVSGQILPEVRFEVDLPAVWNKRLYMFGNGGFAGEQLDSPSRMATRAAALKRNFAVASTNTGHDGAVEPLASFAVDRQKLLDYAFRSLHVTAITAKRLAQDYYSTPPARSYFDGCSTGGRQGLILSQRFPDDFDGVVVGAPVLNFTGTMVSYVSTLRALAAAPIQEAKLALLADRIYQQCDALDGLKDGLIDDPRKCSFTPSRDLPKCATTEDAPGCFTSRQIETLETLYGDVKSQGKTLFPGWPVGAEIQGPQGRSGWSGWIVSDNRPTISRGFAESFFRFMAVREKDYDVSHFDLEKDLPKLNGIHTILDATDTDLSRFRSRGGKIVMYYGWADPALNPLMGVGYYEAVQRQMGSSTTDFFRLFMVPGMFHCSGGVGTSTFDAMTPLIKWVEHGSAPDQITAAQMVQGSLKRTRPLCPYPESARYKGSGRIDDVESFHCVKP